MDIKNLNIINRIIVGPSIWHMEIPIYQWFAYADV